MAPCVSRSVLILALTWLAISCSQTNESSDSTTSTVDTGRSPATDLGSDLGGVQPDQRDRIDTAVVPPPPETHTVVFGDAADGTFHVGPHVMHTTQTSVIIVWETTDIGIGRVEFGPDESYGSEVVGAQGRMHEVTLTGLQPATQYHYRACVDDHCTADLTLASGPVPGQTFRFAVYGDSRSDPATHGTVAANIVKDQPVVVFNVGDVVGDGLREQYKEEHFDPTRLLGHHVPIYVAIGNHEWKEADALGTEDVPNFREYMAFPEVPELRIQELSYSFTYGDAFFLVLDNTLDGGDLFFELAGVEMPLAVWLREQAESDEAKAAKWRFAFMHYPPGSPCEPDGGMMVIATRDEVVPLLRDNGFHALFAGHVHDYERYDYDGFPVVVTGGGGAGLEDITTCEGETPPEMVEMASVHHHLTVDLADEEAHVRAFDLAGDLFDQIAISVDGGHR